MPAPRSSPPPPPREGISRFRPTNMVVPDHPSAKPKVSPKQPVHKQKSSRPTKIFRRVKLAFKSFPSMTTPCKMPAVPALQGGRAHDKHHGAKQITGTLYGHRKASITLAIQDNPRSLPLLLLELSVQTGKLLQDMGMGLVRIALECEKKPSEKLKLINEPIWSMYCNGKKLGYAVKREPTNDDLSVMQMLHPVSMGAGVLPSDENNIEASNEGEMTYMRAFFERVIGSKDSETYYMLNPDGNSGPELSLFFVRI
ncbi:hypothetical protein Leryth_001481 [Lithospermum erythrorhizon]|nr:hypothetical protein Leryth_001481 [Lithospermum erythrorhizon]